MFKSVKILITAIAAFTIHLTATAQHKIGIAAHRGFWKCVEAGNTQNSIASLREAQANGFWGSEVDVHLTSDNMVIVNHDNDIQGIRIHNNTFDTFKDIILNNGEKIPTLDSYLKQAKKSRTTVLVLELKNSGSKERDRLLAEISIQKLKAHGLYKPERVIFISFSLDACEYIAKEAPEFTNQYLSGDLSPDQLKEKGINGFDYYYKTVFENPEWIKRAHELGMSVNVWTVNKKEDIEKCIEAGVDFITTDEPLLARELLGEKELTRLPKRAHPGCCGRK